MRLTSRKLKALRLSRDEAALAKCKLALEQRDNADARSALEIMRPLWRGVGARPYTEGLKPETAADVLFCSGVLTGWIGSSNQTKDAQELAKDMISESISYYQSSGPLSKVA